MPAHNRKVTMDLTTEPVVLKLFTKAPKTPLLSRGAISAM